MTDLKVREMNSKYHLLFIIYLMAGKYSIPKRAEMVEWKVGAVVKHPRRKEQQKNTGFIKKVYNYNNC